VCISLVYLQLPIVIYTVEHPPLRTNVSVIKPGETALASPSFVECGVSPSGGAGYRGQDAVTTYAVLQSSRINGDPFLRHS